jgi:hypothetical protein
MPEKLMKLITNAHLCPLLRRVLALAVIPPHQDFNATFYAAENMPFV